MQMKYLIEKAIIHFDSGTDNKSAIIINEKVDNVDDYRRELKSTIVCDRIYLIYVECE